eukprot:3700181-Rhodomonas_salina.2
MTARQTLRQYSIRYLGTAHATAVPHAPSRYSTPGAAYAISVPHLRCESRGTTRGPPSETCAAGARDPDHTLSQYRTARH